MCRLLLRIFPNIKFVYSFIQMLLVLFALPFPYYQENHVFAQYSEDCGNLDMKQFPLENSVYIQNLSVVCVFSLKFVEVENQYKTHN
jgi:hypothetical protein